MTGKKNWPLQRDESVSRKKLPLLFDDLCLITRHNSYAYRAQRQFSDYRTQLSTKKTRLS